MEIFWPKTLGPNHHTSTDSTNVVLYGWPVWPSHSVWWPPGEFEAQIEREREQKRAWVVYMTRYGPFQVSGRQRP